MSHTVLSQALEPGVKLGSFVIRDLLGANRHSYIYLAHDRSLDRDVIIKESFPMGIAARSSDSNEVIPISPDKEEAFHKQTEKFLTQGRIMAGLECGGVIPTYGVYEALGTAYAVVAKTNGITLATEIENRHTLHKKWIPSEVQNLLMEILKTLKYLHAHDIYHHKIRPSHILITRGFHPLLIGFDFSGPEAPGKSQVILSTECISPEVLLDLKCAPAREDIYSLAATFHKIILGTYPKRGDIRYYAIKQNKLSDHPILREFYPKAFLHSLDIALAPKQEQRFSSIAEWLTYLKESCPTLPDVVEEEDKKKNVIIETKLLLTGDHDADTTSPEDDSYNKDKEERTSRRRGKNEEKGFSKLIKKLFYKETPADSSLEDIASDREDTEEEDE